MSISSHGRKRESARKAGGPATGSGSGSTSTAGPGAGAGSSKTNEDTFDTDEHPLQKRVFTLEHTLDLKKQELEQKDESILALKRNFETLSVICSKSMRQVEEVRVKLTASESIIDSLKACETKWKVTEDKIKAVEAENKKLVGNERVLKVEIESIQYRIKGFQGQINDLTDAKDEVTNHLAQMEALAQARLEENEDLRLAQNEEVYKTMIDDLKRRIGDLEQRLSLATREAHEHKEAMKAAMTEMAKTHNLHHRADLDKKNMEQDLVRATGVIANLREDRDKLKNHLLDMTDAKEALVLDTESLQRRLKLLEKGNPELEEKLRWSEKHRELLKGQFDQTWEARKSLEVRLDEATATIQQLRAQSTNASLTVGERLVALEAVQEEYRLLLTEKRKWSTEKDDWTEKTQALGVRVEELSKAHRDAQDQLQAARKNKQFLEEQLEAQEKKSKQWIDEQKANMKNKDAKEAEVKLMADLQKVNEKVSLFTRVNHEQETEITSLKKKLTLSEEELERALRVGKEAKNLFEAGKKKEMEAAFADINRQMDDLRKQNHSLSSKLMQEQHTNAEMSAMMDQPSLNISAADIAKLNIMKKELQAAISKIVAAEKGSEPNFTCLQCVKLFDDPVTCIPCGHSFCRKCVEATGHCVHCGPQVAVEYYKNQVLDDLSSKFIFRQQALLGIKQMVT